MKNETFWEDRTNRLLVGSKWDEVYESKKWIEEIPYIQFKPDWLVKIIPPFHGAVVRFCISTNKKNRVSVYLDCYSQLGMWESPYWEVYPYEGDCFRCDMNETDKLIEAIEKSLKEVNDNNK